MGNSCRSQTVDGVMRELVKDAGLQHSIDFDLADTRWRRMDWEP